jgi:geranylgeranyl pyrophosphate synthase
MTTITNFHVTLQDPVLERQQEVEARLLAQVEAGRSPLDAALAALIAAGGKRLRPRLALLAGGMLGAEPAALVNLAAAIEMLHTASLIHDDLVDGSGLRRGVETLNARWSAAASVLVGDLAFTRAAELILGTRTLPVIEMFTRTMSLMVEGEVSHLAREKAISARAEYFRWIGAKTAALFEFACGAPALLGAAGEQALALARRFGYGIGMAFQVVDDVLDFTGNPGILGKPVGSDLRQGVLTLPAILYLEEHLGDAQLGKLLRGEGLEEAELKGLIERIRRSEATNQSLEMAHGFIRQALDELACLPECPERFALTEIALDIVLRDR